MQQWQGMGGGGGMGMTSGTNPQMKGTTNKNTQKKTKLTILSFLFSGPPDANLFIYHLPQVSCC